MIHNNNDRLLKYIVGILNNNDRILKYIERILKYNDWNIFLKELI